MFVSRIELILTLIGYTATALILALCFYSDSIGGTRPSALIDKYLNLMFFWTSGLLILLFVTRKPA